MGKRCPECDGPTEKIQEGYDEVKCTNTWCGWQEYAKIRIGIPPGQLEKAKEAAEKRERERMVI